MGKRNWFVWNLANFVSSLRFCAPFILFLPNWEESAKIICYVVLALTDAVDGPLARKIGNAGGKFIDTAADKVMHGSGIIFLLVEKVVEYWLIIPVILIEVLISLPVIYGIYLVAERQIKVLRIKSVKVIYLAVKKEIAENLYVNALGRTKMVAYGIGLGLVVFNYFLPLDIIRYFYIIMFSAGIIFGIGALADYYKKYKIWQEEYFKS